MYALKIRYVRMLFLPAWHGNLKQTGANVCISFCLTEKRIAWIKYGKPVQSTQFRLNHRLPDFFMLKPLGLRSSYYS
jgi:hypothetical protein